MGKTKEPRYTATARYEGRWRWAAVPGVKTDRTAIRHSPALIEEKIGEAADAEDLEGVEVWTYGGVTLMSPQGKVIWTRPVITPEQSKNGKRKRSK